MRRMFNVIYLSYRSFVEVYLFDRNTVTLTIVVLMFSSLSTYFDIFLSKIIVDSLFVGDFRIFHYSLLALVMFKLLANYLNALSSVKNVKMSNAFNNKCDEELINNVENFDLMIKEHPRFNSDFSYLRYIKGQTYSLYTQFTQLFLKILTLCVGLRFLFEIDVVFFLLAVIFGIVKGLFNLKPIKVRAKLNEGVHKKAVKYVYLFELLTSIKNQKELMLYRTFNYFKQKWRQEKEEYDKVQVIMGKINNRNYIQQESLTILFDALIIILFAYLVTGKHFTIGSYISLTMAVNITIFNFSSLINEYAQMSENYIHYEKLHHDSYYKDAYNKIKTEGNRKFVFRNNIVISNLNFTYPNAERQTLRDVNLVINKGETVAILGENGSGKSTLVKILLGLYRPKTESVFIDGISINDIDSKDMFKRCSVVFQDFIQYQTTIRDNIVVGDIENLENTDRMYDVLKHVDIKLQNLNLETKVGLTDETAINLSGGQWQRLALSRFYYKDKPEMAIFDEPTSALDPITEVRLFNDILTSCKDITTIIISHRVGVAKRADRIIVMENGQIIEQGNHRELINMNGRYSEMWLSQEEWYQEERGGEYIASQ